MSNRRAELIEVKGEAWYPRDVEEALCRVAGVRQAALVGLPDAELGKRPAAYVTLHEGAKLDGGSLKDALRGTVGYDLDPMTVTVVPDLPMTPTGKIAKSELVASAIAARQRVA